MRCGASRSSSRGSGHGNNAPSAPARSMRCRSACVFTRPMSGPSQRGRVARSCASDTSGQVAGSSVCSSITRACHWRSASVHGKACRPLRASHWQMASARRAGSTSFSGSRASSRAPTRRRRSAMNRPSDKDQSALSSVRTRKSSSLANDAGSSSTAMKIRSLASPAREPSSAATSHSRVASGSASSRRALRPLASW